MAKQHGAWAMLLLPFFMGVFLGQPTIIHIPLFIAWLFLYLATYPLLMCLKKRKVPFYLKWFSIYFSPAFIILIYLIIVDYKLLYFGLAMVPFFMINGYFSKNKQERALLNDIAAIISFCIGGLASYYMGTGQLDTVAFLLFLVNFLYFLGSTFYVKTMIREKKNVKYKYVSWGYHIGLVAILVIIGYWQFAISFLPSVLRAILFYGKKITIKTIGIYEIGNAIFFFIVMFIVLSN